MKNINKDKIKKDQQINNLRSIITTANKESSNINEKVIELQNIFKKITKIINKKIKQIQKAQLTESNINIEEIKFQICEDLKKIIKFYNNKTSINNKKLQIQKDIKEKKCKNIDIIVNFQMKKMIFHLKINLKT